MLLFVLGISFLALLCLKAAPQLRHTVIRLTSAAAFIIVNVITALAVEPASAGAAHQPGGEANLVLPDLSSVNFLGGVNGRSLLLIGLLVSALGMIFGLIIYKQLQRLPVHRSMLESPS